MMAIKKRSSTKSSGVKAANRKLGRNNNGKTKNYATGKNPYTGKEFGVFRFVTDRQGTLIDTYQTRVGAETAREPHQNVYELDKMICMGGNMWRKAYAHEIAAKTTK